MSFLLKLKFAVEWLLAWSFGGMLVLSLWLIAATFAKVISERTKK